MRVDYIGYALAIISLLYAYYLHRKGIRKKEPAYSIRSWNVISDYSTAFNNLTVAYNGEKIENFTLSWVLFFNRGAVTIDRNDIAVLNPLKILPIGCKILDVYVLATNNPSSGFIAKFDKVNEIIMIDFEYLNQNDGAVMALIHTGVSSKDIDLVGDVKEVKNLARISPRLLRTVTPINPKRVIGVLLFVLAGLTSAMGLLLTVWRNLAAVLWGTLIYVSTLSIFLLLAWFVRMFYLSKTTTIPKGLEIFYRD